MTEEHPELKKIQEGIDLSSIGVMGLGILKGAIVEGATLTEAIAVTAAWFASVTTMGSDEKEEENK